MKTKIEERHLTRTISDLTQTEVEEILREKLGKASEAEFDWNFNYDARNPDCSFCTITTTQEDTIQTKIL